MEIGFRKRFVQKDPFQAFVERFITADSGTKFPIELLLINVANNPRPRFLVPFIEDDFDYVLI
jgi:hypothetical protein